MKKIFLILTVLSVFVLSGYNNIMAVEPSCLTEPAVFASGDKYMGNVNLCDPNGNICYVGEAYIDSVNGRVYVQFGSKKLYAQESNNSSWKYMVRHGEKWLYFSF